MLHIRRAAVTAVSVLAVLFVLLYVEHPSVRAFKSIASAAGFIDSERTLVGITDIRSVDHVRGDPDAKTVLIEYSDFSCVMCFIMQDTFDRLLREEKVMLVSRHLYLSTESTAFDRAVSAECVAKHAGADAYRSFSRYLYANQHTDGIEPQAQERQAIALGVSAAAFRDCVQNDAAVRERVERDSEEGWRLGARGTPYIVVIYDNKPVGISYANEYGRFLERVRLLVRQARL